MRNRVEKLMKEKRKALSNIKIAKNRSVFIRKVNDLKGKDWKEKELFRDKMKKKLEEQREQCAKQRRELHDNIISSKQALVESNRDLKLKELQMKELKKKEKELNKSLIDSRAKELKNFVEEHRKQK